jgi:hypothetical protein
MAACCCSIRPIRNPRPTIRCSRSAAANGKCATSRTSPTFWSIPKESLEKRNHWEKTSHALLVGAILHVLYAEADKTLAGVAAFLSDPKRPIESTLAAMMKTAHLGEAGPHPVIASAARELLNKSDNERSGVLSTAMSFLGLYRDPVVAEVTRRCDWRITDIVGGEAPDDALPRGAALRHQPHQAADPPDPQSGRPPPDRGSAGEGRPPSPAAHARRVSRRWVVSTSSRARWPSWPATA